MKSVNIRQLKNNPSDALRMARRAPVVVMNRDQPEALLVHLDDESLLGEAGVRLALATALYRSESVSLGRGAKVAAMPLADFMLHLSREGIPVIGVTPSPERGPREPRGVARKAVAFVNASPLIGLAHLDGLGWLRKLYGCALITPTVRSEVLTGLGRSGEVEISAALRRRRSSVLPRDPTAHCSRAGRQRGQLIRAALEHDTHALVIIDELSARKAARRLGLQCTRRRVSSSKPGAPSLSRLLGHFSSGWARADSIFLRSWSRPCSRSSRRIDRASVAWQPDLRARLAGEEIKAHAFVDLQHSVAMKLDPAAIGVRLDAQCAPELSLRGHRRRVRRRPRERGGSPCRHWP
jgi:predicted nucleic acid-binding protein/antitoxin (DNA-binding transcriptional repressor) of toxin-antitoxin stability system